MYLAPSASTPVFGSTNVIMTATIYPASIPKRIAEEEKILFCGAKCFNNTITIKTTNPKKRFGSEP